MKRIITISLLVLAILSSLLAGTMAYYTTSIEIAAGSVTAKEFIFLSEQVKTFTLNEKIAPSETVNWSFKVMNYDEGAVTETAQYYKLTFDVKAAEGKKAIEPLLVIVKDENNNTLKNIKGTQTFDILDEFKSPGLKESREYSIEMIWPADGPNDSAYAGNGFGTVIQVSAVASQAPFTSEGDAGEGSEETEKPGEGTEEPGGEEQPGQTESDIGVTYQVRSTWVQGQTTPQFDALVTIQNNSNEEIKNWEITFDLPNDRIYQVGMGFRKNDLSSSNGSYRIYHPQYDVLNIPAKTMISFDIQVDGLGEMPENVQVNGRTAELTYIPYK